MSGPGGGLIPGDVWSRGVCLVLGGCLLVRYSAPVNRITDRCKNITLATTSLRPVITDDEQDKGSSKFDQ